MLRISAREHPPTWVYQKPWGVQAAWSFIEALLTCPVVSMLSATPKHAAVLQECLQEMPEARGNLIHDLHIACGTGALALMMREHGVARIVTRDSDFHRFSFLQVIDPLRMTQR